MKKILLLIFFALTLLAGNVFAQQWTKMVYRGIQHFGPEENRFWFEYTLTNNGEGHLIYFNEDDKDTLKYNVNADDSQLMMCDSVFSHVLNMQDRLGGRIRGGRRHQSDDGMNERIVESAIIEYKSDDGTLSKKWCNAFLMLPVIKNLNVNFYIEQARKQQRYNE